jgi:hypothetical protein
MRCFGTVLLEANYMKRFSAFDLLIAASADMFKHTHTHTGSVTHFLGTVGLAGWLRRGEEGTVGLAGWLAG